MNSLFVYINENVSEEIKLEDLVSLTEMNKFQFIRHFKRRYKKTPMKWLWQVRIELAAEIIKMNPHMPITNVAFLCGFKSSAHFSRVFKSTFKESALELRQRIVTTNLHFQINQVDICEFITSPRYPFTDYTLRNSLKAS